MTEGAATTKPKRKMERQRGGFALASVDTDADGNQRFTVIGKSNMPGQKEVRDFLRESVEQEKIKPDGKKEYAIIQVKGGLLRPTTETRVKVNF